MSDTKGNMTNVRINSQEASSFFLLDSRMEHFLSFPVRAVLVMAVIYSIWSQGSLTWSAGGERSGLVRLLLLPPPPSRIRSNHNNSPKNLDSPSSFFGVILAGHVRTQPSHPRVQAFEPPGRKRDTVEKSFLFGVFDF